jgi:hypothetical protein
LIFSHEMFVPGKWKLEEYSSIVVTAYLSTLIVSTVCVSDVFPPDDPCRGYFTSPSISQVILAFD